jgi:hypothetical protein
VNQDDYSKITSYGVHYTGHRMAYSLFRDLPTMLSDDLVVRHRCIKTRNCINPAHLAEGTHKKNNADQVVDGTAPLGKRHWLSSITNEQAKQIKDSKGQGTTSERAKRFGTSLQVVKSIDQGSNWAHIKKMPRDCQNVLWLSHYLYGGLDKQQMLRSW